MDKSFSHKDWFSPRKINKFRIKRALGNWQLKGFAILKESLRYSFDSPNWKVGQDG